MDFSTFRRQERRIWASSVRLHKPCRDSLFFLPGPLKPSIIHSISCDQAAPSPSPQRPSALIITTGPVCAANDFDLFRQLQRDAQAAGGYRPHRRRLRQAEEGWGAELFGALSVSCREDGFVFGSCHAAVLSLLWLRRVGRRLRLHPEGRKYYFPGSCPVAGSEARRTHAQGHLFQSGGGSQRPPPHGPARRACARDRVFSGLSAASRRGECPRVPEGARA